MGLFSSKCTSTVRLDGKTALITGCNTGIGKITAKDFFQRGAKVIMACRNMEKAKVAADEIKAECKDLANLGAVETIELDLTSFASVKKCANEILQNEARLDLLVNNAGIMACPYEKTKDGFELQFGTNHLGHFLLTMLLLPKIIKCERARIVNVSSVGHKNGSMNFEDLNWENRPYSRIKAYAQSKLANILFTRELAKRLKDAGIDNVTTYSLHPGVIKTELGRHLTSSYFVILSYLFKMFSIFMKSVSQGAQTTIYCSISEDVANESGEYYADCKRSVTSEAGQNMEDAERLWNESLKMVGFNADFNPFHK